MKPFFILIIAGVAAISYFPLKAIAQDKTSPENPQEAIIERHEAAALTTEPVTIKSQWNSVTGQPQNLQGNSIPLEQKKGCESLSPFDVLSNPEAMFKECVNPSDNRSAERVETVEYLKVPGLESGVKVNVTKF
ncbi:hypothetical protein [Nostoc sp. MS1]|uniref:hypothetical protein n=1 Tax=Nostoc sp. MS1 TaxID=2764711 RepID=UPI001CC72E24|nr:hypothetical protein [Nostoc sp. MS1]BCL34643.1 hypothetical protein NSMS1_10900 [Nostoc sp. MS1]